MTTKALVRNIGNCYILSQITGPYCPHRLAAVFRQGAFPTLARDGGDWTRDLLHAK